MPHSCFELAWLLADALAPVVLALLAQEPLLLDAPPARRWRETIRFWLRCALGVGGAVALAEIGKAREVWPGYPGFPSGHTTFVASAATCMALRRGPRWRGFAALLALLMAWAVVMAGWHRVEDAIGALLLGPTVAAAAFRWTHGRPQPEAEAVTEGGAAAASAGSARRPRIRRSNGRSKA